MHLIFSALLSANMLFASSFPFLSPYHFLCQDNIFPKNNISLENTFILSETPEESSQTSENSDILNLSAPSVVLMEASTGTILYEKDSHTMLHPASITKIMTLILIFDAIESGQISLDDTVTVSEYAASMGGSQVFLEPNETQTVSGDGETEPENGDADGPSYSQNGRR
jgi:D-alanyl-D-alanine carboxypeptidase (penicillin-binding protein 5/6)